MLRLQELTEASLEIVDSHDGHPKSVAIWKTQISPVIYCIDVTND